MTWTWTCSNYDFFSNTCSHSLVCKVGGTIHVEPKKALRSISIFVVVLLLFPVLFLPSLSLVDSPNVVMDYVSVLVFLLLVLLLLFFALALLAAAVVALAVAVTSQVDVALLFLLALLLAFTSKRNESRFA